jgi:hypothetical protein
MRDETRYERVETTASGFKRIRLKSGRLMSYWDARDAADRAETDLVRAISRTLKLANDDYDLERLEWFMERMDTYVHVVKTEIEKRRGVKSQEERIALLRNTTGRTPEEAAEYQRKADELEAKLHAES